MGASGGRGLLVLAACAHEGADDVAHCLCVCGAGELEGPGCLVGGGGHLGAHLHALGAVCSEYIGGGGGGDFERVSGRPACVEGGDEGGAWRLRWAGGIAHAGPGWARGAFLDKGGVGAIVGAVCGAEVGADGLGAGDLVLGGGLPGHGAWRGVHSSPPRLIYYVGASTSHDVTSAPTVARLLIIAPDRSLCLSPHTPMPDTPPHKHHYTSLRSLIHSPGPDNPSKHNTLAPRPSRNSSSSRSRDRRPDPPRKADRDKGRLSTWKLMCLTVSMGGSQIAWTVYVLGAPACSCLLTCRSELGYGTPYLLSLGLSEQLTSLVWLAGPISGLIAQPLIGAISDSSHSRYRRRYWIVTSTMLLVFSGLGLAFTEPIAKALVDLTGGGQGDWDPKTIRLVRHSVCRF